MSFDDIKEWLKAIFGFVLFGGLIIAFIYGIIDAKNNPVPPPRPTHNQKMKVLVDDIRQNDDAVRRRDGLAPRNKKYYDNMYESLKK